MGPNSSSVFERFSTPCAVLLSFSPDYSTSVLSCIAGSASSCNLDRVRLPCLSVLSGRRWASNSTPPIHFPLSILMPVDSPPSYLFVFCR